MGMVDNLWEREHWRISMNDRVRQLNDLVNSENEDIFQQVESEIYLTRQCFFDDLDHEAEIAEILFDNYALKPEEKSEIDLERLAEEADF
jgi:NifB/MoaA-like Fe-S oxidoreductase